VGALQDPTHRIETIPITTTTLYTTNYNTLYNTVKLLSIQIFHCEMNAYEVAPQFYPLYLTLTFLSLQRKGFVRFAQFFPLTELFGVQVDPHMYRSFVGMTEVVSGIMLGIFQGKLDKFAAV